MSRLVVTVVALWAAGCTYAPGNPGLGPSGDARVIDGMRVVDSTPPSDDSSIDGRAPFVCAVPDTTGLVLCLELDDPSLATAALDASGLHHDAMLSNTSVANPPRSVPITSQAAQLTSTSSIVVPDSNDFNVQTFTLMAWVQREASVSSNHELGVLDVQGQFQIKIDDQTRLKCSLDSGGFATSSYGSAVVINEWDLVACTYDGNQICSTLFRGGSGAGMQTCQSVQKTISTQSTNGITIGDVATPIVGITADHFLGKLDSARMFTRALTVQQICLAGGRTGC
ncbi:MAG: putative transrane protein [Myxococcales bacterium]|nr:putative transrane protein [Myxococcales bacterium]